MVVLQVKLTQQMLGPLQEAQKRQEILDKGTVKFLKTFEVIGMTITGAATRLHLLGMCINKSIENGTVTISKT